MKAFTGVSVGKAREEKVNSLGLAKFEYSQQALGYRGGP